MAFSDARLNQLCDKLVPWITSNENINKILIPFIVNDQYVSKRLIYWTVSKYAQMTNITILQSKYVTNVYEQYSNHLRLYNRRLFDVFCRQPYLIDLDMHLGFDQWIAINTSFQSLPSDTQQLMYEFCGGQCVVRTTLGQLNFFYWAAKDGILAYVRKYESRLMDAMKQDSKRRRDQREQAPSTKKHRQLTKCQRPSNELILLYRPCSVQV
jgi:hypothetical protein